MGERMRVSVDGWEDEGIWRERVVDLMVSRYF